MNEITTCRRSLMVMCMLTLGLSGCISQKTTWKGKTSVDEAPGHADASRADNLSRQKARIARFSDEASCADTSLAIVGGSRVQNLSRIARSTARLISSTGRCSATLVGPRHLITAAHCMAKAGARPIEVRFGIDPENPNVSIAVEKWLLHPQYRLGNAIPLNDIAVLVLEADVPREMTVVPFALEEDLSRGTDIVLAGYGSGSEDSQQGLPLSMTRVPLETVSDQGYLLTEINGKGSCYGDSGGPGYVIDQDSMCMRVAGVISRASIKGNGQCGQGNTMMDVTYFKSWIEDSFALLESPIDSF